MKKAALLSISLVLSLALLFTACNLPQSADKNGIVNTAVALTVAANTVEGPGGQTQPPPGGNATQEPTPTDTETPPPTSTPFPTDTDQPTNTPIPCNRAEFVDDVTVPDGMDFLMGETFTKIWRLENTGSCTWTADYDIVFTSGDRMDAPDAVQLTTGTVETGETVDVSVDLTAPDSPGKFRGNWKLRDDEGTVFGIENSSSGYFWVEIEIDDPGPETVFDLHAKAPSAYWVTSAGEISFGGPDNDADGFAMYKDGEQLEDGSSPGKILEMHPEWVDDGVISGRYSSYTVEDGDHFKTKIGFLALSDGSCGAGDAVFQLNYREGGSNHPLDAWTETCDGSLTTINVDLSSLDGKTIKLVLAVTANGPSTQDWAVWVNPRVDR